MRVLIVDDEAPARARLRRLLADEPDVEVVGEAGSGPAAVTAIAELAPDLVLLDIQMPGLDGFGVIETVGAAAMPPVVFVTAYDAHALRAFEAHALDYLLKPIRPERFAAMLERVRRLRAPAERSAPGAADPLATRLDALLAELGREPQRLRHVLVHHEHRALLLPVERIVRIAAERNYLRLFVPGAEYTLRGTIGALEARLDPAAFLRIGRGDIVRLDAIRELHPWSHGDYHVILKDGTELVWSRRYRAKSAHLFGEG
ncbi:MAG TPA: response regulator [Gemmatimonadales bacterium]|nr:response regulator [Gemmatimonadales bacterium]